MAMREYERQQAAELRRQEKEEDRAFRAQQDALYRNPAGSGSNSSRGGGGGIALDDISEGGKAEGILAREAGVDVPTLRALRKGSESGDWSAFKRSKVIEDESGGHTRDELPEGFEAFKTAKLRELATIEKKFAFGKDYKDVAEGEKTAFQTDVGRGIIGGTIDSNKGAAATATTEGKAPFDESGGVVYSTMTGANKATPVGQSQINENNAQAGKATADANRVKQYNDPETMRIRSDFTQRERTMRSQLGKVYGDEKSKVQAELDALLDARKEFEANIAASKTVGAKPKSGDNPKSGSNAAPYKEGTKLRGPDGKTYVVRNGQPVLEK
jgi:hypothetical protein